MANLNVTEFAASGDANDGRLQIAQQPSLAVSDTTTSGTPATVTAFQPKTRYVRLVATGNVYYRVNGTAGQANNTSTYLTSGVVEYIGVPANSTLSVVDAP